MPIIFLTCTETSFPLYYVVLDGTPLYKTLLDANGNLLPRERIYKYLRTIGYIDLCSDCDDTVLLTCSADVRSLITPDVIQNNKPLLTVLNSLILLYNFHEQTV